MNREIKITLEKKTSKTTGKMYDVYYIEFLTKNNKWVKCMFPLEFVYGRKEDTNPKKFKAMNLLNQYLGAYKDEGEP